MIIDLFNCRQSVYMFQNIEWPFLFFLLFFSCLTIKERNTDTEKEREKRAQENWQKMMIDINLFFLSFSHSLSGSNIIVSFSSSLLLLPMNIYIIRGHTHRRRRSSQCIPFNSIDIYNHKNRFLHHHVCLSVYSIWSKNGIVIHQL